RRSPFYRPRVLDAAEIGLNKVLDRLNSSVRRDQAIRGDAQPGRRCGLAGRVNPTRGEAAHVRQQLALADTRISDHEHVDVPADAPAVGHDLGDAAEKLQVEREPLGLLAAAEPFGRLLDLELLRVDEERGLREELELRRARGALASALLFVALERLAEGLPVLGFLDDRPASEALEQGVR